MLNILDLLSIERISNYPIKPIHIYWTEREGLPLLSSSISEYIYCMNTSYTFTEIDPSLLNPLNSEEEEVILHKGTEYPHRGIYTDYTEVGTYYCKQCGEPLYSSTAKFDAHCGWPAFDKELEGRVTRVPDADGMRTEILCSTCSAHLGHVFEGEGFTPTNTRHCVNSISMTFKAGEPMATALYAGGCFWGTQYLFSKTPGVWKAESGYSGGDLVDPTYQDVLTGRTGHYETVKVTYNPLKISYEELTKYFLEIHDPSQVDGQGPDIGEQYKSVIFYRSRDQFETALKLIHQLEDGGMKVATQLLPQKPFYRAEFYHQDYYQKKGTLPYCHYWTKRF